MVQRKYQKWYINTRNGIWKNRENTRNGTHIPKMVYEKTGKYQKWYTQIIELNLNNRWKSK